MSSMLTAECPKCDHPIVEHHTPSGSLSGADGRCKACGHEDDWGHFIRTTNTFVYHWSQHPIYSGVTLSVHGHLKSEPKEVAT
jgi:hypothetical protein